MVPLHLIELCGMPIFEQLQLEEALIRTDQRNICIINWGVPRAIVLGLSGDPEELFDTSRVREENIPVIRRYSGGGCVIVDEETFFVSFLVNKCDLAVTAFPEPILRWGADFYRDAWNLEGFQLRENDFAIDEKKCGGNAQYIQKERWSLHTSFLWNYQRSNMDLLKLPKKRPSYRKDRSHEQFLCSLSGYLPNREALAQGVKQELSSRFVLNHLSEEEFPSILSREHRKSTHYL